MRVFLKILFGAIFVWMVYATTQTSLRVSLRDAWDNFSANPWAVATLCDAYAAFIIFFIWVVYQERGGGRLLWFVLIMCPGNIARSAYVLRELFRLPESEHVEAILWRRW